MYKIQSILFYKKKYSLLDAIDFLMRHNYKIKKLDETKNYYRFRQYDPNYLKKRGYSRVISKKIGKGILFIIYYTKQI
jgi:hypothetical protein